MNTLGKALEISRFRSTGLVVAALLLFSSCSLTKGDWEVNRKAIPEIKEDVAQAASEIREIRHENKPGILYFSGQMFTKKQQDGSTRIERCRKCRVMMKGLADTSVSIRMTSKKDGYFQFRGKASAYALFLDNEGLNSIIIDRLDMGIGGRTHMVIINAAGNRTEQFSVIRNNKEYTWRKLP